MRDFKNISDIHSLSQIITHFIVEPQVETYITEVPISSDKITLQTVIRFSKLVNGIKIREKRIV